MYIYLYNYIHIHTYSYIYIYSLYRYIYIIIRIYKPESKYVYIYISRIYCWIENWDWWDDERCSVWNLWFIHCWYIVILGFYIGKMWKRSARIDFCSASLARLSVDDCWIAERRCCEQRRTEDKKWAHLDLLWLLPLMNLLWLLPGGAVDRWCSTGKYIYSGGTTTAWVFPYASWIGFGVWCCTSQCNS